MKSDPMRGIRHAIAFIFGTLYSSCWWAMALWWNTDSAILLLPIIGIISGSILIIGAATVFLLKNW